MPARSAAGPQDRARAAWDLGCRTAGPAGCRSDRKPRLLRPLAVQLLSPPLAAIDAAERLGIDLSSLHTAEDLRQVASTVLAAVSRGEIVPAEAARIARRAHARLRIVRRLARFEHRLAYKTDPVRTTL